MRSDRMRASEAIVSGIALDPAQDFLNSLQNALTSLLFYAKIFSVAEKYPRGRRGSPAKGVVRETVARVQIPLSPPVRT